MPIFFTLFPSIKTGWYYSSLTLWLALLFFCTVVNGQVTISGYIRDENNNGLEGANVLVSLADDAAIVAFAILIRKGSTYLRHLLTRIRL